MIGAASLRSLEAGPPARRTFLFDANAPRRVFRCPQSRRQACAQRPPRRSRTASLAAGLSGVVAPISALSGVPAFESLR